MKVLFVYPGNIVREVPLNIMYVSSAIKTKGHKSDLFHFTPYKQTWLKNHLKQIETAFIDKLKDFKPDIV